MFKFIDEKIKEGYLRTTGERESTKCCRSNSNSKSCCIADLKYNKALLLLEVSLTLLPIDGSVSARGLSICEESLSVFNNSSRRPVCFVSSYK